MRVSVLLFVLLATYTASSQNGAQAELPRFEDYPVHEHWAGQAVRAKLRTRADRMYRTQFRTAAKEPPNFAGHFRVITWGCGTDCLQGGLIDLSNGQLFRLPRSKTTTGPKEMWPLCGFVTGGRFDEAATTSVDSRLLIVECSDSYGPGLEGPRDGTYLRTSYFVFGNGRFHKIAEHIGQERVF